MSNYSLFENQKSNDNIDNNTDLLDKLVIISTANKNFSSINNEMKQIIDEQQETINNYKLSVFILVVVICVLLYIVYQKRKNY
jgi:hypothetical protein